MPLWDNNRNAVAADRGGGRENDVVCLAERCNFVVTAVAQE